MGKSFKMVLESCMTHENVPMNSRNNFLMGTNHVPPIGDLQMEAILIWQGAKTQKMMKITTQKVILAHIMHQDASESKNERF